MSYRVPACVEGLRKKRNAMYQNRIQTEEEGDGRQDQKSNGTNREGLQQNGNETFQFPRTISLATLSAKWDLSSLTTGDQTDRCPLQWKRKVPTT